MKKPSDKIINSIILTETCLYILFSLGLFNTIVEIMYLVFNNQFLIALYSLPILFILLYLVFKHLELFYYKRRKLEKVLFKLGYYLS